MTPVVQIKTIADWFSRKKTKQTEISEKLDIPGELWVKCFHCKEILYNKDLEASLKVCPKCEYHFKLTYEERLAMTVDAGTFTETEAGLTSTDFLHFKDSKPYGDRIQAAMKKSKLREAIITGEGKIEEISVVLGLMDFRFMGGSMGSVVGEKVTRAAELAHKKNVPLIIVASSGGARMQEGIMSLMQMAKTSDALARLAEKRVPFISVITDPTTGGTTASFAMLGDVNLAEPGALIGFAGPRVIEQTIRQKLPPGFQRSEYLQSHGMVDAVVKRRDLRGILVRLLRFFVK